LPEHAAKTLLREAGIDVPDGRVVRDEQGAVNALAELGGRMVLKVSAPTLRHKSELGALALDIASVDEAVAAYRRLSAIAVSCAGSVLAEQMVPAGVELLVAATVDAVVPALILGMGGIWTEILDDVAVVPLPATVAHVEAALRSLRGSPLLSGGRGQPVLDIGAASRVAQRVGALMCEGSLEAIELNPVIVGERGAVAVDAAVRSAQPVPIIAPGGPEEVPCTT
jgi:succinyl-CoA synthetase beta subunit